MADGITMTLEGSKQLDAKMLRLGRKVSVKISKDAVRKASKVILVAAKANAKGIAGPGGGSKMSALIARALQLKVAKAKFRDQFRIRVQHNPKYWQEFVGYTQGSASLLGGVNARGKSTRGKIVGGRRYYIPNAIEYGHAFPGKAGGSKGVAAKPYMRPAFDSKRAAAARTMERELFDNIERAWRVG